MNEFRMGDTRACLNILTLFCVSWFVGQASSQSSGYNGWVSVDEKCWYKTGVICSMNHTGCPANHVTNKWGRGCHSDILLTSANPTFQSSTAFPSEDHSSSLAVDGIEATCALTSQSKHVWWRADLRGLHIVQALKFKGGLLNQTICEMNKLTIFVGNMTGTAVRCRYLGSSINANKLCSSVHRVSCEREILGNMIYLEYQGSQSRSLSICYLDAIGYEYPYNIAYGKHAIQSRTYDGRNASLAINGVLDLFEPVGQCSCTGSHSNQWWEVDLGAVYDIFNITLVNTMSSSIHMTYMYTYVSNTSMSSGLLCYYDSSHSIDGGRSYTFACSSAPQIGRYVRIESPYRYSWVQIQLCEVMVQGYMHIFYDQFGWEHKGDNCWHKLGISCSLQHSQCVDNPWGVGCEPGTSITLNQPAVQSGTFSSLTAGLGVDGSEHTCASTSQIQDPYWLVELPGLHMVYGVKFKGGGLRMGNTSTCESEDVEIFISNGTRANTTNCKNLTDVNSCNEIKTIYCHKAILGNTLMITIQSFVQLRVCEIDVIGYQYPYNIAYGRNAAQSGIHSGYDASLAVDGVLTTYMHEGSCSKTAYSSTPWLRVDMGKPQVVFSVGLLNVQDLSYYSYAVSYTKLNSFNIYVGNDTNVDSENNLICHRQYSTYLSRGALEEFQCTDGPLVGRYVIISLRDAGDQRYLTLCEVIVKGFEFKECPLLHYGPTCSFRCECPDQYPHACDAINGTCCGLNRKGSYCEETLPALSNRPLKLSKTHTSVHIRWDAWSKATGTGSTKSVNYTVEYRPRLLTTGIWSKWNVGIGPPVANITGLQRCVDYSFRVVVTDENNWTGEPTPELHIQTCNTPLILNPWYVSSHLDSSKTKAYLVITWPHNISPLINCETGRVEIRVVGSDSNGSFSNIKPEASNSLSSTTFRDLAPYTNYTISATITNNAFLSSTDIKEIQTPEGVPQAPQKVIIKTRSRSSLTIGWEPIQAPHGKIIAYEVQYWRTGNTDANYKSFNKSTVNENSIVLTDLPMNIEFTIKIRAHSSVGPGVWSNTALGVTAVGKPEEPQSFKNTSRGQTFVSFHWEPPRITNGDIIGYKIWCSGAQFESPELSATVFTGSVEGLQPETTYLCEVKAKTSAGFGLGKHVSVSTTAKINPPINTLAISVESEVTTRNVSLIAFDGLDVYRLIVETVPADSDNNVGSMFPEEKVKNLMNYMTALQNNLPYYVAVTMDSAKTRFTLGDGKYYSGYFNQFLQPGHTYNVWYGGIRTVDGATDEMYIHILTIKTKSYLMSHSAAKAKTEIQTESEGQDAVVSFLGCLVGLLIIICIAEAIFLVRCKRKYEGNGISPTQTISMAEISATVSTSRTMTNRSVYEDCLCKNKDRHEQAYYTTPVKNPKFENPEEDLYEKI